MELVNLENIFYFKKSNGDLLHINSNTRLDSSITQILNTGILFEENNGEPLLFYKKSTLHNGVKSNINDNLYQALNINKIKKENDEFKKKIYKLEQRIYKLEQRIYKLEQRIYKLDDGGHFLDDSFSR